MHTHIYWSLSTVYSPALDLHRVLYAYVHPRTRELLYIGKADKQTVRERLFGQHKQDVFNRIQHYRQINRPHILVGHPFIPKNNNFSSELLSDIESLHSSYSTHRRRPGNPYAHPSPRPVRLLLGSLAPSAAVTSSL